MTRRDWTNSLIFHSIPLLATLIFSLKGNPISKKTEILPELLKVNIVGMPRMTQKELRALPQMTDRGEEVTSGGLNSLLAKYSGKSLGIKKHKRYKKRHIPKSLINAGNQISKGEGLHGQQTSTESGIWVNYLQKIRALMRPFWKLPEYLQGKGLHCRIRIFLNSHGDLVKTVMVNSSGNREYDSRAISVIQKSAPFPLAPEEYKSFLSQGKIVVGFPL